jgi:cytochrome c551
MKKQQGTKASMSSKLLICTSLLLVLFGCSSDNSSTAPPKSDPAPAPATQVPTTPDPSTQTPPAVSAAEEKLYEMHCLNCHGEQLKGGYGPSLEKVGSKYSEEEILKILAEGTGRMPSQKYIPDEDRQQLAKWLAEKK